MNWWAFLGGQLIGSVIGLGLVYFFVQYKTKKLIKKGNERLMERHQRESEERIRMINELTETVDKERRS